MDGESETLVPIVYDTTQITSKANRSNPQPGDAVHPLTAGGHPPLLARTLTSRNDGSPCADRGPDVVVGTMMSNGDAHSGYKDEHGLVARSGVRRLTPVECERLQGFPDGWTRIPVRVYKTRRITKLRPVDQWDKVEGGWALMAADGPRYKALGNSMAVPVMRWIGERIEANR